MQLQTDNLAPHGAVAFIRIAMMICAAMAAAKGVVVDGSEGGGDFTAGINLARRRHRRGKGKEKGE